MIHGTSWIKFFTFLISLFSFNLLIASNQDLLILLHGLGRHASSMRFYEQELNDLFEVHNIEYPSRQLSLEDSTSLVSDKIKNLLDEKKYGQVHFIAHSMGGLIALKIWEQIPRDQQGIIITLGTPYNGSPVLNFFSKYSQFQKFYGPIVNDLQSMNQYTLIKTTARPICFYGVNCPVFLNMFGLFYDKKERHDCLVSEKSACYFNSLKNIELSANHESMLRNEEVIKLVKNTLLEAVNGP